MSFIYSALQAGGKYLAGGVATFAGIAVSELLTRTRLVKGFASYGTFIFGVSFPMTDNANGNKMVGVINSLVVPPPTQLYCDVNNRLVPIPIMGMDGEKQQHLGRKSPRVVMEGYFLDPLAGTNVMAFLEMTKFRKSLPFFSSIIPAYRMMHLKDFHYEGTKHQGDIKYRIELVQDREYGYP